MKNKFYILYLLKITLICLFVLNYFMMKLSWKKSSEIHFVQMAKNVANKSFIILTFANSAQIKLAKHFSCNLKKLGLHKRVLILSIDKQIFNDIQNFYKETR